MKKLLFFGILLLLLLPGVYYFSSTSIEGDVFKGYLIEGSVVDTKNALVLADTDCIPDEEYRTLTCTAILNADGEILKVRYTHPIDVPCLSRGDKVNISMKDDSIVEILRIGKPSMEH